MGAFSIIFGRSSPERDSLEVKQSRAMADQGFLAPVRLEFNGGVLFAYSRQIFCETLLEVLENGDFVALTGTFFYRARTGAEGLRLIYRDFSNPKSQPVVFEPLAEPIHGTYACIVSKEGELSIFTDRLGLFKVFMVDDRVFSSSLLTTIACADNRQPNTQGIFEYVFQGATYGDETVIKGLDLMNADSAVTFDGERLNLRSRRPLAQPQFAPLPFGEHVERVGIELDRVFDDCVEAFNGRIDTALSGGYDSRLILAHLITRDVRPNIHVYGAESDPDVRVAKAIAEGEGLTLTCVDKSDYTSGCHKHGIAELVEENFQIFDGLPPDGIFDWGADLATRRDRANAGAIALNGGGGEIFRNFFYLPNRPFNARQLVWSFYRQFDPRALNDRHTLAEYQARLEQKLIRVLGVADYQFSRAQVERVYPVFRCRYWMGRNNSINNRLSMMHTPLVEPSLVEAAGAVPVAYKNGGALAAALIAQKSGRLAAYTSAYGYGFGARVPRSARLTEKLALYRPPCVRRWTFPVKSALKRIARSRGRDEIGLFSSLVPCGLPNMREYFRTDRIVDPGQFNRLHTLEYFFSRYL